MYADSSNLSRLFVNALSGAATATGLLGFAAAGILISLQGREPVRVDTNSLTWWRSVEMRSERISPGPVAPAPKVQLRQRHLMALRSAHQPQAHPRRSDRIVQTQAAPRKVIELEATPADLLAMRSVHQILRSRFVAVMNTQPKTIRVAQAEPKTEPKKDIQPSAKPPKKKPGATLAVVSASVVTSKEIQTAPKAKDAPPKHEVLPKPSKASLSVTKPANRKIPVFRITPQRLDPAPATQEVVTIQPIERIPQRPGEAKSTTPLEMAARPAESERNLIQREFVQKDELTTLKAAPLVSSQPPQVGPQPLNRAPAVIEYSRDRSRVTSDGLTMSVDSQNHTIILGRNDYSIPTSSKKIFTKKPSHKPIPLREPANGGVTAPQLKPKATPRNEEEARSIEPAGLDELIGPATPPEVRQGEAIATVTASTSDECPNYRDTIAVRAFDGRVGPIEELGPAATEVISHEGPFCGNQARWVYTAYKDHWPTLSLRFPADLQVPMLSSKSLHLLARLRALNLESGAGVVFGWLPAGYDPKISGRSEQPYFYTVDGEGLDWRSSHRRRSEQRFFILLNVEPGVHLLHLQSGKKGQDAAIAVPVQSGTATYLDLREIRHASVRGRVMDGSSRTVRVLENVSVAVLGQEQLVTMSNSEGEFEFKEALLIGEHPLYFETNGPSGTTHRYRFSSKDLKELTLFRFNESQVHSWLRQLEGGVSPESGLILAATPETVAREDDKLLPEITQLFGGGTLLPETYTLDTSNRLLVNQALSLESPRFIGVQVPSGGNLAHLLDSSRRVRWSELVVSSPGVLTLVGPY